MKVKKLNNLPSKKKQKTLEKNKKQKTKLLLRQLQSIELNKLPRKTATCCVRKACEGNVSTVAVDVLYARILG